MRGWFSFIIDALVPPRRTEVLLQGLTVDRLQQLGGEGPLPYHDPRVQALIWEIKYYGSRRLTALAGAYLSEQLLALAAEELGVPLLLPVPMHKHRRRIRGHNHTELLCTSAVRHLGAAVEYRPELLRRTRDTPTQQGLPRAERLNNVKHSMEVPYPEMVAGRACIVLDDVVTTGATLEEAARALTAAGARSVQILALARS